MNNKWLPLVLVLTCMVSVCFAEANEDAAWDYFEEYVESNALNESGQRVVAEIFGEAVGEKINDKVSVTEVLNVMKGIEALSDGDFVAARDETVNLVMGHFVPGYGVAMGFVKAIHTSGEAILENWMEDIYNHPSYNRLSDLLNSAVRNGYASGDPYLPSHYCRQNDELRQRMIACENGMFDTWSNDNDTLNLLVKGGYAARLQQKLGFEPTQRQIFHHFLAKASRDQKDYILQTFKRAHKKKAALKTKKALLAKARKALSGPATNLSLKIDYPGDVLKAGQKFTVHCHYSFPWPTKHLLKIVIKTPFGEVYTDKSALGRVWRAGSFEHPISFDGLGNDGHYTIDFFVHCSHGITSLEGIKLRVQPGAALDSDGEFTPNDDNRLSTNDEKGQWCIVYVTETPPGTYPERSVAQLVSRQAADEIKGKTNSKSIKIQCFNGKHAAIKDFVQGWSGPSFYANWDEGFINYQTGRVDVDGNLLSEIRKYRGLAPPERAKEGDTKPGDSMDIPLTSGHPAQMDPVIAILSNQPWGNSQVQTLIRDLNKAEAAYVGVAHVDEWGRQRREGVTIMTDPRGSYDNPFHYQWLTRPDLQKYVEMKLRGQPVPPDFLARYFGSPKSAAKAKEDSYLNKLAKRRKKKEPSYLDKLQKRREASDTSNQKSYLDKLAKLKTSMPTVAIEPSPDHTVAQPAAGANAGLVRMNKKAAERTIRSTKSVLLYYGQDDCLYSRKMYPIIKKLAGQYGHQICFIELDHSSKKPDLSEMGISTSPAFIAFRDGEYIGACSGFQSKEKIEAFLQRKLISAFPASREEIGRLLAQWEKKIQDMKRRVESDSSFKPDEAELLRVHNEFILPALRGMEKLCGNDNEKSEALFLELMKEYAPEMSKEMEKTRREAMAAQKEIERQMKEFEEEIKAMQ